MTEQEGYEGREILSGFVKGIKTGIVYLVLVIEMFVRLVLRRPMPARLTSFITAINEMNESQQAGYHLAVAMLIMLGGYVILKITFRS